MRDRHGSDLGASALARTKAAGLIMAGTITFASNGQMANLTAFHPPASGDPADLSSWTPAALQDGQPVLNVHMQGAQPQNIVLEMGFKFTSGDALAGGGAGFAAGLAADPSLVYRNVTGKELGE